jgi:drug/metabolite transporter (DMT)-like permease
MRWVDLLHPERLMAAVLKLCVGFLLVVVVASCFISTLSRMSGADAAALLLVGAFVSVIAYFIRQHRMGRRRPSRSTQGAERSPLIPRSRQNP